MFGHMGGFGNWNGYYGPMYGRGFGGFSEILLLILIAVVVYLLIKRNKPINHKHNNSIPSENHDALEIAKLRYVKGEISLEEYQKIASVIKS